MPPVATTITASYTPVVATYTVTYDGGVPARVVAVCDTADGRRCVSIREDPDFAAQACEEELIGTAVRIGAGTFTPD